MTRRCPVRSLANWALNELANTVVTTVGRALATADDPDTEAAITIVTVQTHLEYNGATADIYQDLLQLILSSDRLEANVRFTCLQALLNGSVQSLVSEIFPFSFYEKILQVIAAQGSGLRALNLKGVWVKEEHMPYMYAIARNCPQLRRLCIPYVATDELLEQIAKSAERLSVLDISGETDITDIGIAALCSAPAALQWLRIVDIGTVGEENVCHTDIAQLIVHLPLLESLVSYSYVGQALVYARDNLKPQLRATSLRYLHDTRTSDRTMDAIVALCPQLESVYLDTPERGVLGRVRELRGCALQRLKVHKFCCAEFSELSAEAGGGWQYLTLIKGRGRLDLGRLTRQCCGLLELDLYMMEGLVYLGERTFERLQGLEMLSSPLSSTALRNFVCRAPRLQRLAVDQVTFSDEEVAAMLIEHDFAELEDVWFTSAPNLTVSTVELLMERCPELQNLGQLSGWSLTPDDVALLRGLLKSANSALVLTPTSIFP